MNKKIDPILITFTIEYMAEKCSNKEGLKR